MIDRRGRQGLTPPARRGGTAALAVAVLALVALFGVIAGPRAVAAPTAVPAGPAGAAQRHHDGVAPGPALARDHDGRPRRAETAPFALTGASTLSWRERASAAGPADAAGPPATAPSSTRSRAPPA
jgi:hypothetical protein